MYVFLTFVKESNSQHQPIQRQGGDVDGVNEQRDDPGQPKEEVHSGMLPVHDVLPVLLCRVVQLESGPVGKLLCQNACSAERTLFIYTACCKLDSSRKRSNWLPTSKSVHSFLNTICLDALFNLPTKEKKTTTELSIISSRRCKVRLASRLEPGFLFLRVTCQSECFPVHQSPATRKKLPGSAWPLKLPMTYTASEECTNSRKCLIAMSKIDF